LNKVAVRTADPVFPEYDAETVIVQVTPSTGVSDVWIVYLPVHVLPELSAVSTFIGTAAPLGLTKLTDAEEGEGEPSWLVTVASTVAVSPMLKTEPAAGEVTETRREPEIEAVVDAEAATPPLTAWTSIVQVPTGSVACTTYWPK
jgi:hypothetical protein